MPSGFSLDPTLSSELSALATQIETTAKAIAENPHLSPQSRVEMQQELAREAQHFVTSVRASLQTVSAAQKSSVMAGIMAAMRALGIMSTRAVVGLTLTMEQIQAWIDQNFGPGPAEAMETDPMEHAVVTEFGPRVSATPETMIDLVGFTVSQMAPANQSFRGVAGWVDTNEMFGLGKGSSGAGAPSTDNGGIGAGGEGGVSGADSGTGDSPGGTAGGGQSP